MKPKAKREGPLSIPVAFDEAITRALKVKPPPGGWAALDRAVKKKRRKKAKPS